jgi:hypothetical protein
MVSPELWCPRNYVLLLRPQIIKSAGDPTIALKPTAALINRRLRADATVVTFWPGYFLETGARIFPGSEDHFGLAAAAKLDPDARRRYYLISDKEMNEAVRVGAPAGVLPFSVRGKSRAHPELLAAHYTVRERLAPRCSTRVGTPNRKASHVGAADHPARER